MALSIDVNLPRSHTARFPDRCVVCGRSGPASHVRLLSSSIGWWTIFSWFGRPSIVKAPACRGCGWKLHGQRTFNLLLTVAIVVAAFWLVWPHLEDHVPKGLRRWAMIALGIVCLAPYVLFEVMRPQPFNITVFGDSIDYEFASEDYAGDFAMCNSDAAWLKIDGTEVRLDAEE